MRKTVGLTAAAIVLCMGAFLVSGQSLLDNPDYTKAKELQQKARKAMDAGDYDKAAEYAEESETYLEKSDVYVATSLLKFKANGKIQVAEERLTYAKGIGAETTAADKYTEAVTALAEAKAFFENADYTSSIESADEVLSLLESIAPMETPPAVEPAPSTVEAGPASASEEPPEVLPKYYTVRLIPERRDCFWRIAEYVFVYGDPWQWPTLYEANKVKLEDPENPRIIQPGMVFEIPSIAGEARQGMYEPEESEQAAEKAQ